MADAKDLVRAIKQAAEDAGRAGYPVNIMTGTVTGVSPLAVRVEQRFTITGVHLIVPEYLTDHKVKVSFQGTTMEEGEDGHRHDYEGVEQEVMVHNGLRTGDHVVLIRQQGGQKYLIAGRTAKMA